MQAGLGWIDFSKEHRDRVGSVLDLMTEPGTVDELGIGTMRDAISDWLFPGLSTIQTRPKYFLILLQILTEYKKVVLQGGKVVKLSEYLYGYEDKIMGWLTKNDGNKSGVMGYNLATRGRGETLARKPSSIYWAGIRTHGMIDTSISLNEYLKRNDMSSYGRSSAEDSSNINARLEGFEIKAHDFECIGEDMTLELSVEEAEYLVARFSSDNDASDIKQEHNLLKQLMQSEIRSAIIDSKDFDEMANTLIDVGDIHAETQEMLRFALAFDLLIRGAFIRYNLILDRILGADDNKITSDWQEWKSEVASKREQIQKLDFEYLYDHIVKSRNRKSKNFLMLWQEVIVNEIYDDAKIDQLIVDQERRNKGAKSKLVVNINPEKVGDWEGMTKLTYRYDTLMTFIKDIDKAYARS